MHNLRETIEVASRRRPADLVLKGGQVVNVFTNEIIKTDVAICGERIAALGKGYEGGSVVQLDGMFVAPGLIDAHIHMESSMLHPMQLAKHLLGCGTTTVVADPHEIANVAGLEGIRFMMDQTLGLPFDAYFLAPSCVPASHLETSGARVTAQELKSLTLDPRILGLGEVMDYPGVVSADEQILAKVQAFGHKVIDGHAPQLSGDALQAYISVGIRSDHECTTRNEALEKIRAGMTVMIREGSIAKNLAELVLLVSCENASRFCLVSDDLHPQDILREGHMNRILKKAASLKMDPLLAIKLATLNPALFFRLYDRGAVAAGYRADLVIFSDLRNFDVWGVIKDGKMVISNGRAVEYLGESEPDLPESLKIMRLGTITPEDLKIPCGGRRLARVMELVEGQILTKVVFDEVEGKGGRLLLDTKRDILKVAVVERYSGKGRIGLGLVRGFGLKKGAIASSIAHDSHNIIAVGADDKAISAAINEIKVMGGGICVAAEGGVIEGLALPIAGLMSSMSAQGVVESLTRLGQASRALGCPLSDPFMALSFLALPVIPEIRVTDYGIIDVEKFDVVPLFE